MWIYISPMKIIKTSLNYDTFPVCPPNKKVMSCSPHVCIAGAQYCPDALCLINPCGGCKAEFFNTTTGARMNCYESRYFAIYHYTINVFLICRKFNFSTRLFVCNKQFIIIKLMLIM